MRTAALRIFGSTTWNKMLLSDSLMTIFAPLVRSFSLFLPP